jgi:hypothetical protein
MRYLEGCTLTAFTRGSRALVLQIKATGYKPTWSHAGVLATGTWLFWPTIGPLIPAALTTTATLWLLAALILGNTSTDPTATTPSAGDDADEHGQEEEPETTAPTPAETHLLTVSLTASGSSVLLTRLAADLGAAHPGWEASTKTVRTLLSEAGIPVREGVRTPDGNGPGVHHQDVPPLPSPSESAPLPGVVANVGAGQSANANANNGVAPTGREGFTTRPDPDNPARTIVCQTTAA